jgi:light-regulated signal transduction histidine kinase (bacteriophytochrome)
VSAHWVLLTDAVTEHRRIISTHTDITARLQMQEELETANARLKSMALELERSNEELEQFARMASHDLTAPITSTRWLVDLLSARHGNQLDAEGQKFLKQITLGLDRMADLIDAVLAHSLVGKSSISSQVRTSAEVAWSAAVANLQKDIQTSKVVITRDPLPELYIQSQPLTRLFQNLLSNAIKYRRPEVPLQVKVTVAREGSMYLIGIHDNGMGIESEWFERIFQPMQRRHGAEVAGSGIGLATCKKIVTRAGGRIWVESEVGVGSSFYFTLPAPRD